MTKDDLEVRVRQLRAELIVQKLLTEAIVLTMTPALRAALAQAFNDLSTEWLATGQSRHPAPSTETIFAVQRTVDHTAKKLHALSR
jgi:hypothetical protein